MTLCWSEARSPSLNEGMPSTRVGSGSCGVRTKLQGACYPIFLARGYAARARAAEKHCDDRGSHHAGNCVGHQWRGVRRGDVALALDDYRRRLGSSCLWPRRTLASTELPIWTSSMQRLENN